MTLVLAVAGSHAVGSTIHWAATATTRGCDLRPAASRDVISGLPRLEITDLRPATSRDVISGLPRLEIIDLRPATSRDVISGLPRLEM